MKTFLGTFAALCLQTALCAQITAEPVSGLTPHRLKYDRHDIHLEADTSGAPDLPMDRAIVDHLGWGCNGVTGEDKAPCVKGIEAKMRPGQGMGSVVYQEVHTKSELMELVKKDFTASASLTFGSWGVSAKVATKFESQVHITNETITIVGKLDYHHGSPMVINQDDLVVTDKVRDLYRNNYPKFFSQYGDGFVTKVDLGESLYFFCQSTVSSSSKYSKSEIRVAMNAKVLSIVEANAKGGVTKEMEEKLLESRFTFKAFSTGSAFLPTTVSNKAEYDALVAKLQAHISDKQPSGDYSVLRSYITPYAYAMEKTEDPAVAANIEKLVKWSELRNKIQSVLERHNTDSVALKEQCLAAIKATDEESGKCRNKHPEARAPKKDEYWDLQVKWMNIYAEPLACGSLDTQFWPYYITGFMPLEPRLADKCSLIGVKLFTRPMEGFDNKKVYCYAVGGAVTQYNAPKNPKELATGFWPRYSTNVVTSTLISTDEFEVKKEAFHPGNAIHIGYVLVNQPLSTEAKQPLKGLVPFYRHNGVCSTSGTQWVRDDKGWKELQTLHLDSLGRKVFDYSSKPSSDMTLLGGSQQVQLSNRALCLYRSETTFDTSTLIGYGLE